MNNRFVYIALLKGRINYMGEKRHRMYADFSEKAYDDLQSGDAMFNNGFRSKEGSYYSDQPEFSEIDEFDMDKLITGGMGALIGVACVALGYAYHHRSEIKRFIQDEAIPWMKDKFHVTIKKKPKKIKTLPIKKVRPKEFSTEIDTVLNEYSNNMDNEETQQKLVELMILAALLANKIRELSNMADFKKDSAYYETKESLEKLMTQKTTDYINQILCRSPELLSEKNPTFSLFYGDHYNNGQCIPFQNERIKELLRLES